MTGLEMLREISRLVLTVLLFIGIMALGVPVLAQQSGGPAALILWLGAGNPGATAVLAALAFAALIYSVTQARRIIFGMLGGLHWLVSRVV